MPSLEKCLEQLEPRGLKRIVLVRPPGFEPGFPAVSMLKWEAGVIDQAARQRLYSD
jgi:hypothetical protein